MADSGFVWGLLPAPRKCSKNGGLKMFGCMRAAGSKYFDVGGGVKMHSGFNLTLHTITLALDEDGLCMVEKAIKYC
jgi:hypothetical protein